MPHRQGATSSRAGVADRAAGHAEAATVRPRERATRTTPATLLKRLVVIPDEDAHQTRRSVRIQLRAALTAKHEVARIAPKRRRALPDLPVAERDGWRSTATVPGSISIVRVRPPLGVSSITLTGDNVRRHSQRDRILDRNRRETSAAPAARPAAHRCTPRGGRTRTADSARANDKKIRRCSGVHNSSTALGPRRGSFARLHGLLGISRSTTTASLSAFRSARCTWRTLDADSGRPPAPARLRQVPIELGDRRWL